MNYNFGLFNIWDWSFGNRFSTAKQELYLVFVLQKRLKLWAMGVFKFDLGHAIRWGDSWVRCKFQFDDFYSHAGCSNLSAFGSLMEDCKKESQGFNVSLIHVKRQANMAADNLAKAATFLPFSTFWNTPPLFLYGVLDSDVKVYFSWK